MWNLRIDAAAAEVMERLAAIGVDSMILKGPALSEWYGGESDRTYVDADIWVAPDRVAHAEAVLRELEFVPGADEGDMPDWWLEHGSAWERGKDATKIDLHRRLQGTEADPRSVWDQLWARREPLTVAGKPAYRLPEDGRVLYATLHATHHGVADARGLPHLEAALAAVSDATWKSALELAVSLDALESFATRAAAGAGGR